jgi:Fe-S-cluster containining protein
VSTAARKVSLAVLDALVEERAARTRAEHPWWPCAEGCDTCCRSLPTQPVVTRDEWERLSAAIDTLSTPVRDRVRARIRDGHVTPSRVCPMLDEARGACLVYDARPVACRTYGFYAERDAGLHCEKVTRAVAEQGADVVWGNGEAVAAELRGLGEARTLGAWLALLAAGAAPP